MGVGLLDTFPVHKSTNEPNVPMTRGIRCVTIFVYLLVPGDRKGVGYRKRNEGYTRVN